MLGAKTRLVQRWPDAKVYLMLCFYCFLFYKKHKGQKQRQNLFWQRNALLCKNKFLQSITFCKTKCSARQLLCFPP